MRLSSSLTFVIRTVLPVSWALLLPVAVLVHVPDEFEPMRWFMLTGLGILLLQSAAWFIRLKDVVADADGLVIANGRESARIPWAQIDAIRNPWWGKGQFARIELRTPSRFGRSVLFMLTVAPFTRWSEHPSVRIVTDHIAASQPPTSDGTRWTA
jgi:hypothetical protein